MQTAVSFKAAILEELGKPLVIRDLDMPGELYPGQVHVRIAYTGICGKQLVEQSGILGADKYLPHCMGHEASGWVIMTGPGVHRVKIGDPVVLHWRKGDGIEAPGPKYWSHDLHGYVGAGPVATFSEHAVVSENRITKITEEMEMSHAALFGCAIPTGLGLIDNEAQVKLGQSVVVVGCGGVGLNVIQGAKLVGAYPIVAMDMHDNKLAAAKACGAHYFVNTRGLNIFKWSIEELLNGRGADYVVDTTGHLVREAWNLAAPNGKVFYVAQSPEGTELSITMSSIHNGRRLYASEGGGINPSLDLPRYMRLLTAGLLDLSVYDSGERWNLNSINDAMDAVRSGRVNRALISMLD